MLGQIAGDRGESRAMFKALGYVPNLAWPRSFSEKVVRRKLSNAPPLWSECVDKVAVRQHVARLIGPEYLTVLHAVVADAATLSLRDLPERCVVKANHGSGWNRLINGDGSVTEANLRAECAHWLSKTYGVVTHEPWYFPIPPRVLVEEYLEDRRHGVPLDYKFWVFHGRVEFIQIDFGRFTQHTRTIYDRRWNRQPWCTLYPSGPDLERPKLLDEMTDLAERLAVDPDFVRIDLYSPNDECIRFGEITFAPGAGLEPFSPSMYYDFAVGELW